MVIVKYRKKDPKSIYLLVGPTEFIQHIERLIASDRVPTDAQKVYNDYSIIKSMRFIVVMEKDEDEIYVVTVPSLPGCISDGRTVEESMLNKREATRRFIDDMNADGETIPHDIDIIGNIELNV